MIKHNDIHHGTRKRYEKGCRCEDCRKVATAATTRQRKARVIDAPDFPHGQHTGYACGCRCEKCSEFRSQYLKELRGKIDFDSPDFKHGSHYSHGTLGCRCELCSQAEREYRANLNQKRDITASDFPHGTRSGYKFGCRCEACKDATNAYGRIPANSKQSLARWAKRRAIQVSTTDRSQTKLLTKIYLHCPEGYTVDHITPLSKGGQHTPDNLQYLTLSVNCKKGNKIDFDCSTHALHWRDIILVEPSTVIESTPLQVKASRVPPSGGKRIASQVDDDMTCSVGKLTAA